MRELSDWELDWLNADWIKVADWQRTFTNREARASKTLTGHNGDICSVAWLLQRQYRLSRGQEGTEVAPISVPKNQC